MAVIYCHKCGKLIDLDTNVEHFEDEHGLKPGELPNE